MKQRIKTIGYVSPVIFFLGLGLYYINGLWDIYSISLTVLGAAAGILYLVVCFDDLRQIFSARSFRSGTNTLMLICLVLSLIVIVNVIGYRHFYWQDITVKKKFELSILTQSILDQIKQEKKDIYITAFFWMNVDRNLSKEQNITLIRQNQEREGKLRDLLAVYNGVNPAIQYRFIDPNRDIMLSRQYDVGRYRDNVTAVECGGNKEMVVNMDSEEQLTNALIKVLSTQKHKVYFLEGHQESSIEDGSGSGYMMVATAIRDQSYDVQPLNVLEAGGVPKDCRALVIEGVRKPLLPEEIRLIDDYLENGGRVLVCVDPEYDSGMGEWLLGWGIRLGQDMVVDNSTAGVRQGAGPNEPLLYSYDKEHPITRQLMKAFSTMPTVRSVRPVDSPPEGLELTVLARTGENSWGETDRASMAVKNPIFDTEDLSGPVPVAVAMLKKLPEKTPGVREVKVPGSSTKAPSMQELKKIQLEKSQRKAQLVVFGDTQFASNSYLRYGGNMDLFMNAVNWLIGDERLITIRPKDPEDQMINITQRQVSQMALVLQWLLPAAVVLSGIWVWVMRLR